MQGNTQSDNSENTICTEDLLNEALDMLDHARNIDDMYQSLRVQGEIIKFLLWLIDNLEDDQDPDDTIKIKIEYGTSNPNSP